MTVYVDNQNAYGRVVRGTRTVTGEWSRLLADDPAELAEFALNLGLLPEWVRAPGTPAECYDVGEATGRRAIAAGAVPISSPRGTRNVIATKTLQAAALDAAGRGWPVFPLQPGSKVPAVKDWEHEATLDVERITELWTANLRRRDGWIVPEPRNLGVACGPSGLVVVDLDVPKVDHRTGWVDRWASRSITPAVQVLDELAAWAGQTVPETYTVATPSGGRHLYFTAPDGAEVRNSAGRVGPMVDVRGQGGYVVGPGSRIHPHYYGPNLELIDHGGPGYRLLTDLQPVSLPDWIADAATPGRDRHDEQPGTGRHPGPSPVLSGRGDGYGAAALRGEVDRVRSAPAGQRNHTLNAAAFSLGQLVAAGVLDRAATVDALTEAAHAAGLTVSETAATVESGIAAGGHRPRVVPGRFVPADSQPPTPEPPDTSQTHSVPAVRDPAGAAGPGGPVRFRPRLRPTPRQVGAASTAEPHPDDHQHPLRKDPVMIKPDRTGAPAGHRTPYVGAGEDGARRSADMDRDQADGLAWTDDRHDELIGSAERWEQQAHELTLERLGPRPALDDVRRSAGSEQWLAAIALLELSPDTYDDAAQFTAWSRDGGSYTYEGEGKNRVGTFHPDPVMDWDEWVADVDGHGRGWSSTGHRLFQLVASLVVPERPVRLNGVLDYMGSWEGDVWRILTEWGTGGNNRDRPGRYTVDPTRGTAPDAADQAERSPAGLDDSYEQAVSAPPSGEAIDGQRASMRATADAARVASDRWSALVDEGPGYDDAGVERARAALLSALADSANQIGHYLADQPANTPHQVEERLEGAEAVAAQDALWTDTDLQDPAAIAGPADPDADLSGGGDEPGLQQPGDTGASVRSLLSDMQTRAVIDPQGLDATIRADASRPTPLVSPDTEPAPETHDLPPVPDTPTRPPATPPQPPEDAGPEPQRDNPRTAGPEPAGPEREEPTRDEVTPAAAAEKTADPHTTLGISIEQAQAALAQAEASRTASRRQASADLSDRVIDSTPPAYWAEPGVDL